MKKVLVPLRVSTDSQDLESQKVDMIKFVLALGYSEEEIYFLEAKGASAFKQDEDYLSFIKEIKRIILEVPSIERVAVWHINRLGRNEKPLMDIKEFLVSHKTQLTIKEPAINLLNEDGTVNDGMDLCFSLFSTMSRQQIQEFKAKSKRSKKLMKQSGKYTGGKILYGYSVDDKGFFQIDPETSKNVVLIFDLYANHSYSSYKLEVELKSRGIKKEDGTYFTYFHIESMLRNESYLGINQYPQLISKETWNKVVECRKKNNIIVDKTKHILLGAKLLVCPCCGSMMVKSGHRYGCWRADRECKGKTLSIDSKHVDQVLTYESKFYHISYLNSLSKLELDDIQKEVEVIILKIGNTKAQIEGLSKKKEKVQEAYEEDIYTKEKRNEKLKEIQNSEKQYKEQIVELEESLRVKEQIISRMRSVNKVDIFVNAFTTTENETRLPELYNMIHQHIKKVEFKKASQYCFDMILTMKDDKQIFYRYQAKSKNGKWYKLTDGVYQKVFQ